MPAASRQGGAASSSSTGAFRLLVPAAGIIGAVCWLFNRSGSGGQQRNPNITSPQVLGSHNHTSAHSTQLNKQHDSSGGLFTSSSDSSSTVEGVTVRHNSGVAGANHGNNAGRDNNIVHWQQQPGRSGTALALIATAVAATALIHIWTQAEESLETYLQRLQTAALNEERPRRYIRWRCRLQPSFRREFVEAHRQATFRCLERHIRYSAAEEHQPWNYWFGTTWPKLRWLMQTQPESLLTADHSSDAISPFLLLVCVFVVLFSDTSHDTSPNVTAEVTEFIDCCDVWLHVTQRMSWSKNDGVLLNMAAQRIGWLRDLQWITIEHEIIRENPKAWGPQDTYASELHFWLKRVRSQHFASAPTATAELCIPPICESTYVLESMRRSLKAAQKDHAKYMKNPDALIYGHEP